MKLTWDVSLGAYSIKDVSLDPSFNQYVGVSANSGSANLFIDQSTPMSGYTIEALTTKQIAQLNAEDPELMLDANDTYYTVKYMDEAHNVVYMASAGGQPADVTSGHNYVTGYSDIQNLSVWRIFTRAELITYLKEHATEANPLSATSLIMDPDFSRYRSLTENRKVISSWWTVEGAYTQIGGENYNHCAESWYSTFNFYQTLTDLPAGKYRVSAQGAVAYYSDDDITNTPDRPILYATTSSGTQSVEFIASKLNGKMPNGEGSMSAMSASFANPNLYVLDPIEINIFDGKLTVGFKGTYTKSWAIFDNLQLEYCGPLADALSLLKVQWSDLQSKATELQEMDMNRDVKEALKEAANVTPAEETETAYNEVIATLDEAIKNAETSIAKYKVIAEALITYTDKARETLDGSGNNKFASYNFSTQYEDETLTSIDEIDAGWRAAVLAQTTAERDMTEGLYNPDFELGSTEGWTYTSSNDHGAKSTTSTTYYVPNGYAASGNYLFNIWSAGNPISQTVHLHAGHYQISAMGATDAGHTLYIAANDEKATFDSGEDKLTGVEMILDFELTKDQDVTISAATTDAYWYKVDNFKLYYIGAISLDKYYEKISGLTADLNSLRNKDMNVDVEANLLIAYSKGKKVVDNPANYTDVDELSDIIDELTSTLAEVKKSVEIYSDIKEYITKAQDLDDDGLEVFNSLYTEIKNAISNGSITDGEKELEEIQGYYITSVKQQSTEHTDMTEAIVNNDCSNGMTFNPNGWNHQVYPIEHPIGWDVYDANTGYLITDDAFHVNNWSTEADEVNNWGGPDGSVMEAPFAELYGLDRAKYPHVYVKHDTETGYRSGTYNIKIYARMRETGSTSTLPTGMSFYANEVTSTSSYTQGTNTENMSWYAWYEVPFVVSSDGIINFGFELKNWNFNWLAFKFVKLEFVSETYSEEQIADLLAKVPEGDMNIDVKTALDKAVANFKASSTIDNGKILSQAISTAYNSVKLYEEIRADIDSYTNKSVNLDAAGSSNFNNNIMAIQTAYDAGTLTANNVADVYYKAVKAQGAGAEMTEAITNPDFETGSYVGWTTQTSSDTGARSTTNSTFAMVNSHGNYLFNTWATGYPIAQTITGLQPGRYTLIAAVASDEGNATFLFAQTSDTLIYKGKESIAKTYAALDSVEFEVPNDGMVTSDLYIMVQQQLKLTSHSSKVS
jgi:hypothetical protein